MKQYLFVIFVGCYFIGIAQDTTITLSKLMLNEQDKIFQPFLTTKPTSEGTGLGLGSAYDIAKAHSGEIEVLRNFSEATEIKISIPWQKK